MPIVDAQIHLWNNGLPSNMSHRQVTSFPAEEAIAMMDEAGVDAAVIHLVHWDHDCFQVAASASGCAAAILPGCGRARRKRGSRLH